RGRHRAAGDAGEHDTGPRRSSRFGVVSRSVLRACCDTGHILGVHLPYQRGDPILDGLPGDVRVGATAMAIRACGQRRADVRGICCDSLFGPDIPIPDDCSMTCQLLINIDVDDLNRAAAFYCPAFGLSIGRRFGALGVELLGATSPLYLLAKPAGT